MSTNYYRTRLDTAQKEAYDILVNGIYNMVHKVRLPLLSNNKLSDTVNAVCDDHPDFFFLYRRGAVGKGSEKNSGDDVYYRYADHIDYPLRYDFSPEKTRLILKKIEMITDNLIYQAKLAGCRTDLGVAAYIHDYLTDNVSYTDRKLSHKRNHCIIGPLVNNECVCEGFAKTYLYMMDRAGIPALMVSGKAGEPGRRGGGHAWNMIQIRGRWYHVDVTWDSVGKGKKGKWDYFMLTEAEMSAKHHTMPANVRLPESGTPMALDRANRRIR